MPNPASRPDPNRPPTICRNRPCLLAALADIETEGWDGVVATALLSFVRDDLVRPLVIDFGLRGGAASQAEATGWATAWEVLADPRLLEAESPWGVVWTAVRRAIQGEQVAARYGVAARTAWRLAAAGSDGDRWCLPPVSLTRLAALGWQPADRLAGQRVGLGPILTSIIGAMNGVGWDRADAELLVGKRARASRALPFAGVRAAAHERSLSKGVVDVTGHRRSAIKGVGQPPTPVD